MEERFMPAAVAESRPLEAAPGAADAAPGDPGAMPGATPALADPRALQILSTEHWSLLTARSLVYNEAFARGGMFLAFLSATLLVLGLIATATAFSDLFLVVAAMVLGLDLFVGIATLGRINSASAEDLRYLQGMNRLRNAYHEMVPGLEGYFITSKYDDFESVVGAYGPDSPSTLRGIAHGLTTMPGMISVICCAIGSVLVGILILLASGDGGLAGAAAAAAFLVLFTLFSTIAFRSALAYSLKLNAAFPAPGAAGPPATPGLATGEGRRGSSRR